MNQITINLTDKEYEVLQQLSTQQELSEEKVLIQGLRLYQLSLQKEVHLEKKRKSWK